MHEYFFNWLSSLTGKPMSAGHEILFNVYRVTLFPHKILNQTRVTVLRKRTILVEILCHVVL